LARLSPSRYIMYCRLWVPGQRAEPFFPLSPRRPCWIINPGAAAGLPPTWVAASAPNAIIPAQSLRCGLSPPASCSGSCLIVPSAEPAANLQHPRLLPQRKSVDGNGWAQNAMHPRAIALYRVSLKQYSASLLVSRPLAVQLNFPQHTDSKVHEPGPRCCGPTYAGRTTDLGRGRWHE